MYNLNIWLRNIESRSSFLLSCIIIWKEILITIDNMAIIIAIVFGYLRVSVIYRNQFHRVFHREGTHRTNISYLRPPPVAFSFSLLAHPAFPALRPSPLNLDHATNEGHVRSPPRIRALPFSRSSSYDSLPLSMPLSFSLSHTHTRTLRLLSYPLVHAYIYRYTRACAIIRTHIQRNGLSTLLDPPPQYPPLSSWFHSFAQKSNFHSDSDDVEDVSRRVEKEIVQR